MYHNFVFNGVSSRQMHLLVESLPPLSRPPVRYQSVQLPGRAGDLTLLEGTDIYEPYLREVRAMPMPGADIHAILGWLRGSGTVSFSHEPDRQQAAKVLDQLDFAHAFADQREGTIRFLCDPFKMAFPEEAAISYDVANHPSIDNPGDVIAWPDLTINGSGAVAITINGTRQAYTGLVTGRLVHVECTGGYVYTRASEDPNNANYAVKSPVKTYGDFPYFSPGSNTIALEGTITALTIAPHWRWL
jgi:phage-related protein